MISFPRTAAVPLNLVPETDADQDLQVQTDTDLRVRVVSFLADCHMPGLRQLNVEAQNGVVTLRGLVKTYYEKQVGGQRARRVAGVVKLVDRIDVAIA